MATEPLLSAHKLPGSGDGYSTNSDGAESVAIATHARRSSAGVDAGGGARLSRSSSARRVGESDAEFERDLREAFELFDVDNSGTIDTTELRDVLMLLGLDASPAQLRQWIRVADKNNDGELSFAEFAVVAKKHAQRQTAEQLREAFDFFDLTRDNTVTAAELQRALQKLGDRDTTIMQAQRMVAAASDGGDAVSYEQFARFMSS